MSTPAATMAGVEAPPKLEKKPIKFSNLLLGSGLNMFEVSTLGQVSYLPKKMPLLRPLCADRLAFRAAAGGRQDNHGGQP